MQMNCLEGELNENPENKQPSLVSSSVLASEFLPEFLS